MTEQYDFKNATYQIGKHEAGHWLAAFKLGWKPRNIEIRVPFNEKGHFGSTLTSFKTSLTSIADVRSYALGRVKILYSGAYAEHFDGKEFNSDSILSDFQPGGGAYSDYCKAEEIYFFYHNCLEHSLGWEEEFKPIIYDVQLMVQMHFNFINSVALHLAEMAHQPGDVITISGERLAEIFNSSKISLPDFS